MFKYSEIKHIYPILPEKRGRKPGTSWNGETRVERMGGISAGVGGGGGSARLY